jgi:hypothetical protein
MLLVYLYLSVYVSPPIVLCIFSNDNMSSGTPNHHESMSSGTHNTQGSTSSGTPSDVRDGRHCGERPPSVQAAGSALGANVSASSSSSSVEATSSSNQEMGATQPDPNRGDCLTGAAHAGNLLRTHDMNAASKERQPPSSVTLSGPPQPPLQSSSRRRFSTPEIRNRSRLHTSVYLSNLERFTISQVRDFYGWMRLNSTLPHETYPRENPRNLFAGKYVVWTRDYHQQPRPVTRHGNTLEIPPSNLLAAMTPYRLTEPGEGWQHDPQQRTYLVSEEMFVYLIMALSREPDGDVAVMQERSSFVISAFIPSNCKKYLQLKSFLISSIANGMVLAQGLRHLLIRALTQTRNP